MFHGFKVHEQRMVAVKVQQSQKTETTLFKIIANFQLIKCRFIYCFDKQNTTLEHNLDGHG